MRRPFTHPLLLLLLALGAIIILWSKREGFTSPGTLVQLATSRPEAVYWVRRAPPHGGAAIVAFG